MGRPATLRGFPAALRDMHDRQENSRAGGRRTAECRETCDGRRSLRSAHAEDAMNTLIARWG